MYVINAVNVRDALPKTVQYLLIFGKIEETRGGEALVAPSPVTICYRSPKQHVLINSLRDANPFFHLIEAMWMLAGRDDGKFLDHYIKNFSRDFGDQYGIIPDSYGHRWRYRLGFDQLKEIVEQLTDNSGSRQAVLQIWDDDLRFNGPKPCNLIVTFRIHDSRLDMAVFNRSNDLLWGCCGANAVHFPIMQEYIANMIGIAIGDYWQISTNLHLYMKQYMNLLERRKKITSWHDHNNDEPLWASLKNDPNYEQTEPLIKYPESFDEELQETVCMIEDINKDLEIFDDNLSQPFLRDTVLPMAQAHRHYKNKAIAKALAEVEKVIAADWKRAGKEWLQRRNHDKSA